MFGSAATALERPVAVGPIGPSVGLLRLVDSAAPAGSGLAEVIAFPGAAGVSVAPAGRRPVMELQLLGGFRLLVDGELVSVGRSGERLLAVLACRGRAVSRARLASVLWPAATSEWASAKLRTALHRVARRAPGAVHTSGTLVQLNLGVAVDLEVTSRLAQRILATGAVDEALLGEADLTADLLPDWDEQWLAAHQHQYRQLRLTALETLAARLGAAAPTTLGHLLTSA
jgi:DNA-binding SARP family transcriptional activator